MGNELSDKKYGEIFFIFDKKFINAKPRVLFEITKNPIARRENPIIDNVNGNFFIFKVLIFNPNQYNKIILLVYL